MAQRFNPPPGWPPPPPGWAPAPGWQPDPEWPPAPAGWLFFMDETRPVPTPAAAALRRPGQHLPPALAATPRDQAPPAGAPPGAPATPSTRQVQPSRLFGWGGAVVLVLLGLLSGLSGALIMGGIYVLAVSVVALIRGRVRWAYLPTRTAGVAALVTSLVAVGAGAAAQPPRATPTATTAPTASTPTTDGPAIPSATSATSSVTPTPTPSAASVTTTTPDPVTEAISTAPSGSALAALGTLTVQAQPSTAGYARTAFGPAWADTDRNGCDQRNDILRRDLTAITLKSDSHGCVVLTGSLTDPYTGQQMPFSRTSATSSAVDIDHIVALGNAWATGANTWDDNTRQQFANDALNLLATSATANLAKGDADAAGWLPPASTYACPYIARQIAVKSKYHLTVTASERAAMARVLTTCPATTAPAASIPPLGGFPEDTPAPTPTSSSARPTPPAGPAPEAPAPTATPSTPSAPPSSSTAAPLQGVHPGAYCSPFGALGYTSTGTLMACRPSATDSRNRWRAA